jgi:hypothetical protein
MRILYGNRDPWHYVDGQFVRALEQPAVTEQHLTDALNNDGDAMLTYTVGTNGQEIRDHLFENPITSRMAANTALLSSVGQFKHTSPEPPAWVAVEPEGRDPAMAADMERCLAEYWGCARGVPADVEATHWTEHQIDGGMVAFAPGEHP